MTDKEFRATKARITRMVREWKQYLGLGYWEVTQVVKRDGILFGKVSSEENWQDLARVQTKWERFKIRVEFNAPACMELDDEELARTIIHELCHSLVAEMRQWGPEEMSDEDYNRRILHEERVVTNMTNAFMWTYAAGVKEGRRRQKKEKG